MHHSIKYCLLLCVSSLLIAPLLNELRAASFVAATSEYADVLAAVNLATDGDTVKIPPGNSTWTTTLSLKKAIVLRGDSATTTIITATTSTAILVSLPKDLFVRITGIGFNGAWTIPTIQFTTRSTGSSKLTSIRVDNCRFNVARRAINPVGWVYGVIDHNVFTNCNIAVGVSGDNTESWNRPILPGTSDALFVEDNQFIVNNAAPAEPNQQIYCQEGGRLVVRANTFDGTENTLRNTTVWDSHGNWAGGGSPVDPDSSAALNFRAQPLLEFYDNIVKIHHSYEFNNTRGGSILCYNNTFSYLTGSRPIFFKLIEEEAWQTSFFSWLRTIWPAKDNIRNAFFWNNTINNTPVVSTDFYSQTLERVFIQLGRDYWLAQPDSTNGIPAGIYNGYSPFQYPHPFNTPDNTPVSNARLKISTGP